ncbi:hypothetical protein ACGFNP_39855 [Nonomuraea sp. NPDC049269]|uniref:hypothetical protein n=1 Tax=Nonomuraea sp. NPDC049269 TaxID=3364349 RepID=UPI00371A6A88
MARQAAVFQPTYGGSVRHVDIGGPLVVFFAGRPGGDPRDLAIETPVGMALV